MKWADLILGLFAALSPIAAIIGGLVYYRENKQKKRLEIRHDRVQIDIDETTRNNLIQEASNLSQEREEKREEWWAGQIRTLREEIEAERQLSNKRFRRLNQLENWALLHVAWDRKSYTLLRETYPDWEPPPVLPEDFVPEDL